MSSLSYLLPPSVAPTSGATVFLAPQMGGVGPCTVSKINKILAEKEAFLLPFNLEIMPVINYIKWHFNEIKNKYITVRTCGIL